MDRLIKRRKASKEKRKANTPLTFDKLQALYKAYWEAQTDKRCYECGNELERYNQWHIAHIFPKKHWKRYLPVDIVNNYAYIRLACLECHGQFDNGNAGKTPKLLELKNKLKTEIDDKRSREGDI